MFLGVVEDISVSERVTGEWRILRCEELRVLCCGGGHVVGTHEEAALKTRSRWEDNIKTGLKEIEREGVDWINLARERDKRRTVLSMTAILWVV